ncbi:MAG: DUF6560 family protein [Christensenella sp.]|nr:DUF6560 family protein [Christensenella sp.]
MSQALTIMITYALIALMLSFLLRQIIKENREELIQNLKEEHVIIHYPRFYRWVGFACTAVFSGFIILMTVFPNGTAEPWVYSVFGMFVLLGLYLILESYLWRICIHKNDPYYDFVSSFGRKYRIFYEDIVEYHDGENLIKIKTKNNIFYVDQKVANVEFLLAMLKKNKIKEVTRKKSS